MKKLVCILLTLAVVCSLAACHKIVKVDNSSDTDITDESNISTPAEESEEETSDMSVETSSEDSTESTEVSKPDQSTNGVNPILYKVSGNGGVLYLFGSIHVGDERTHNLPSYVMNAYEDSEYLCVEADIIAFEKNYAQQVQAVQKMLCKNGTTIKDHLGTALYQKAKALLIKEGLYNSVYDRYGPAMWASLIDSAALSKSSLTANYGVDRYFLTKAKEERKEVREVESAEFQYDMLTSFSDKLYRFMIESSIDSFNESATATELLYEVWLGGNEKLMTSMLATDLSDCTEEEIELYNEYEIAMVSDRNLGMAAKAESYLAEGKTGFFVVGSAHIIGDGALVSLLRDRGYTVERIRN